MRAFVKRAIAALLPDSLRWRQLRPALYCFTYHRVGVAAECPFDRGVFDCTQNRFRQHVAFLKERFEVVNVERLLGLLGRRTPPPRPLALITFDDGYIDNYTLAYPVLRDLGATAVFFPPTSYVGSARIPWWDEIAWTVRHATASTIRLRGSEAEYAVGPAATDRTILQVLRLVKSRQGMPMREQLDEVREACGPGTSRVPDQRLFVSWDQLREMQRAGMDIGGHTHSHDLLAHLPADAQRRELADSKAILEAELGCRVRTVAYPVGTPVAYTPETCRLARDLGYDLGFNFMAGVNDLPLADPFDIDRFNPVLP